MAVSIQVYSHYPVTCLGTTGPYIQAEPYQVRHMVLLRYVDGPRYIVRALVSSIDLEKGRLVEPKKTDRIMLDLGVHVARDVPNIIDW